MLRRTSFWFYILPPPLIVSALIAFWQYRKHQPDPATAEEPSPDPVEQVSGADELSQLPPVRPSSGAPAPKPASTVDPGPVTPTAFSPAKTLAEATGLFPGLAAQVLPKARIADWLRQSDLLTRIVATVDSLANGASPTEHIEFLAPRTPFRATAAKRGQWFAAATNSLRTKAMVETFCLTDTKTIAAAYARLEPVFDELYRDLGYPAGATFRDGLGRACRVLLDTPVPDAPPALVRHGTIYRFADPKLEGLRSAQKHLLRLGLADARRVQAKIRELAQALQLKIPE